jgi:15-cis-phytoene synthase
MPDGPSSSTSDPVSEAVRQGLSPGSPRHLAVLFAEPGARPLLGALYAFEAEIRRVVASPSHEAAHARLQWWRGEIDRLIAGRPSHPIATGLSALRGRGELDLGLLHEPLSAADLDLARFTYHEWRELEAYAFRASGAIQTLIAGVLAGARPLSNLEREFARRLGVGIREAEILRDLPVDVARGRLYAPLDALAAAEVDPEGFARDARDGPFMRFRDDWRDRVRGELQALPALLAAAELRSTHRHGLVLAALHARLVDCPEPAGRLTFEPFARLWTAWRTALRHA